MLFEKWFVQGREDEKLGAFLKCGFSFLGYKLACNLSVINILVTIASLSFTTTAVHASPIWTVSRELSLVHRDRCRLPRVPHSFSHSMKQEQ